MPHLFKKITLCVTLSSVLSMSLTGCTSAPTRPDHIGRGDYETTKEYVSRLIRHQMKMHSVSGLSIALVDDQKIVWAEGFGYADKEKKLPATAETTYRVGSISKLFTATAAMQLAEQGRLDIDKPLQAYLPEFSVKSRFAGTSSITPRSLMTHHSGLLGDLEKGMWTANPEPFTKVVDRIKDEYAAYPPNFVWAYSNVGVTLLGHAIQNVTGQDFAASLDRTVLRPLGMVNSAFSTRAEGPMMAQAYRNGVADDDPPLRDVPAGGLNSSVMDLSQFLKMVFANGKVGEHQILKPDTLAEMLRPQNTGVALDLNFRMGLGWILGGLGGINIENAGLVAHHGGATMMYNGQLAVLPEHKLGVIVLANTSEAKPVVDEVATEALKLALEAKTGIRQPDKAKSDEREQALSSEDLQSYPGYYTTMFGDVKVTRSGDKLRAEVFGTRFDLVSQGEGQLGIRYKLFGVLPVSLGTLSDVRLSRTRLAGHDALVATTGSQKMLVGEKLEPSTIPDSWRARIGEYEIVNGEGDYTRPEKVTLREQEGFLVIEAAIPKISSVPLTRTVSAIDDNELRILGLGRGKGETILAVNRDGREYLAYSGYILQKKAD